MTTTNNCCAKCLGVRFTPAPEGKIGSRAIAFCEGISCTCHKATTKESVTGFTHSEGCSGIHVGARCCVLSDVRGAIVSLTSLMLDNPDKHGIYPTTMFYERMEKYFEAKLASEYTALRERIENVQERIAMSPHFPGGATERKKHFQLEVIEEVLALLDSDT